MIAERRGSRVQRLVEHNGRWWPGWQFEWLLCDDGRGWRAAVSWSENYERGRGRHLTTVPPDRLRAAAHA